MPVHDWTRVDAGIFHSFHTSWIGELTKRLNRGLLPKGYKALAEQVAGLGNPDVLTLELPKGPETRSQTEHGSGVLLVAEAPPQVQTTVQIEQRVYARKQKQVTIRHVSENRIVAIIEIVSSGNKDGLRSLRSLVTKLISALDQGIHLLVVDLYPPGKRDPHGIHGVISEELGQLYEHPQNKPLTLAAYAAGFTDTAYVQPIGIGDALPDMPLFLTEDQYINVPLEATYQGAYEGVADDDRAILEATT